MADIEILKDIDGLTIDTTDAVFTGEHLTSVLVVLFNPGTTTPRATYNFQNVFPDGTQQFSAGALERLTFAYEKVTITIGADHFSYDLRAEQEVLISGPRPPASERAGAAFVGDRASTRRWAACNPPRMQGKRRPAPTGAPVRAAQVRRRRLVALAVVALLVIGTGVALMARGSDTHAAAPTTVEAPATTAAAPQRCPIRCPARARSCSTGPPNVNKVALTFDDGSCDACIGSVLATLEQTGTPATLFPNGAYERFWDPHATKIRELIASGLIDLGNHTWSHNDVRTMSVATLKDELQRNEDWMRLNFGASSFPIFRPPFGTYNDAAVRRAGKWGWTTTVTWSAGSRDWEGLDANAIVAELDKSVAAGLDHSPAHQLRDHRGGPAAHHRGDSGEGPATRHAAAAARSVIRPGW